MDFKEKYDQAIKLLHDWNISMLGDYDYLPELDNPKVPNIAAEVLYELTKYFFASLPKKDQKLFKKEFLDEWNLEELKEAILSNEADNNYVCRCFRDYLFVFLIGKSIESLDPNLLQTIANKHSKLTFWDGYNIRNIGERIFNLEPREKEFRDELFQREILRLYRTKLYKVGSFEEMKIFLPKDFFSFMVELSMYLWPRDTFCLPCPLHDFMKNGQEVMIGQTVDEDEFQQAVNKLLNWRCPNEMKLCATGKDAEFLEISVLLSKELFPPSKNETEIRKDYEKIRIQRDIDYLYYLEQLS